MEKAQLPTRSDDGKISITPNKKFFYYYQSSFSNEMKKQFKLTPEHIELAKNLNITWLADAYHGAPCVDTKRPYGDSAQLMSIASILGIRNDTEDIADAKLTKPQRDKCLAIHKEMQTALEIILHAQTFEPGLYETENYSQRWVRVNN